MSFLGLLFGSPGNLLFLSLLLPRLFDLLLLLSLLLLLRLASLLLLLPHCFDLSLSLLLSCKLGGALGGTRTFNNSSQVVLFKL